MKVSSRSLLPRRRLLGTACLAPLLALAKPSAAAEGASSVISYVRAVSASDIDAHASFGWDVLAAALERTRATHGDYRLTTSTDAAQALRFRHATRSSNVEVNVVILTISPAWNDILLPVRIPFLRGLLGYRLLVVRRRDLDRFAKINSLADLRRVSIGSVAHWLDTAILQDAGLSVVTGSSFDGLFKMMKANRFQALSRGAHQIEGEVANLAADPDNDLVVEPHLLLHYNLPVYFWFSRDKEGQRRAARVRDGLRSMEADGSLDGMFEANFGKVIAKYDLTHRTIIEIPNRFLSPDDPADDHFPWRR